MRIYADDDQNGMKVPEEPQEHESDLTDKEKRQREWAKFKEMNLSQKLGFFWDYYKWTLVVGLLLILVVTEGVAVVHRLNQVVVLSFAIADVPVGEQENLALFEEDVLAVVGTGDKHEILDIDASVMSGDSPEAVSKLAVVLGAGITDLAILDEENFKRYEEAEAFLSWEEVLGDKYETYRDLFDEEGYLDLSKNEKWLSYRLSYREPLYCGVVTTSKRVENCEGFVEFLSQET